MFESMLGQSSPRSLAVHQGQLDGRSALLVMTVLGVLGLVAFALLYARKRRLQNAVEDQFKAFRTQAVTLLDELDALRKRHKSLPETDPDFKVPMTGATLALYDQVNRDLDGLWERWLKVMEIWDQTQQRIRAGWGLASKPTEEARSLLDGGEMNDLVRESRVCKQRLDQLNQGHERARESLGEARAELAAIQHAITRGTGVLLPSDAHHREIEGAETRLCEAEMMLPADPIGALEQLTRARRLLATLTEHPSGDAGHRETFRVPPLFDELAAAAERLRTAASRLRVADLVGLVVKALLALWALGFILGLLMPLLLPILFLAACAFILAGAWFFWRIMFSWLSFDRRK